jgi:hypothetical protein
MRQHLPWKECGWAIGVLVFLAATYVSSYYATVDHAVDSLSPPINVVPIYRFGGKAAEALFAPMHHLDRRLRRDYWTFPGKM